ncbi:MAG: hypothetical protein JJ900_04430 [Rhodospirillales bacterium]|nr:hypothetical protein [Rhodospirillales bacterium]MBO6786076.1 hypothetical protein [Rhodospirillales bacterium]
MLLEAIQYLTTPCPWAYRRMGYLKELIATEARWRRCRAAWQPHLDRSRAVIAKAADATAGADKAVIIGAGMLADVPLGMLAKKFRKVELVDVCFSKRTRRIVWPQPHIDLRTCDVTGVADALARGELPVPGEGGGLSLADADLVVSANVLSQLPLVPLAYLRKTQPHLDDASLDTLAEGMIRHHLALLETCPGTVCLVTEVERQRRDGDRLIESEDPLRGVMPDRPGDEWVWDIAPRYEVSPDYEIRNRVRGLMWQGSEPGV